MLIPMHSTYIMITISGSHACYMIITKWLVIMIANKLLITRIINKKQLAMIIDKCFLTMVTKTNDHGYRWLMTTYII